MSALCQKQTLPGSFDQLLGERQDLCGIVSPSALAVFRLIKTVGRLLHRQLARLGALQNAVHVVRCVAELLVYVWSKSGANDGTTRSCTIRAILGDKDIIENIDWSGNEDPCEDYAMKLMSAADERRNLR
jgi:hypothetical protein